MSTMTTESAKKVLDYCYDKGYWLPPAGRYDRLQEAEDMVRFAREALVELDPQHKHDKRGHHDAKEVLRLAGVEADASA